MAIQKLYLPVCADIDSLGLFQILKGWRYDSAADWWSFGVLVYEMLIGQVMHQRIVYEPLESNNQH